MDNRVLTFFLGGGGIFMCSTGKVRSLFLWRLSANSKEAKRLIWMKQLKLESSIYEKARKIFIGFRSQFSKMPLVPWMDIRVYVQMLQRGWRGKCLYCNLQWSSFVSNQWLNYLFRRTTGCNCWQWFYIFKCCNCICFDKYLIYW